MLNYVNKGIYEYSFFSASLWVINKVILLAVALNLTECVYIIYNIIYFALKYSVVGY